MTANGHGDLFDGPIMERALEGMVRGLTNPTPMAGIECPHCKGTGMVPAASFGARVRALRRGRGLSTNELSAALGGVLGGSNIRQIEAETNTNPRLDAVRALAAFFGVRPGWLLDGDPE